MPNRKVHLKFDEYLKIKGVIFDDTFAQSVHKRMDKGVQKFGPDHRTIDFYHSEQGIRKWLRGMKHITSQDTLTDYLRVALGHLVLDYIEYKFPWKNEDELIKSAYLSFRIRGFHRTKFVA